MSQGKSILRAVYRIGYPKANEFAGDNFEWLFDWESLDPLLEWFCENIHETNVFYGGVKQVIWGFLCHMVSQAPSSDCAKV